MTRIDPGSPLYALMGAVQRTSSSSDLKKPTAQDSGALARAASQRRSLRDRLAALVAGVDADDSSAISAVAPALLREVLAHELGDQSVELAESPHLLKRLEVELSRQRYDGLWRDLILSLRLPAR